MNDDLFLFVFLIGEFISLASACLVSLWAEKEKAVKLFVNTLAIGSMLSMSVALLVMLFQTISHSSGVR